MEKILFLSFCLIGFVANGQQIKVTSSFAISGEVFSPLTVTEKNGKTITEMDDSILVVSTKDFKTGRRNMKGLASIEVMRVK